MTDSIFVMLLGTRRNGRLKVTLFSVPTTSVTVSVIMRDALYNKSDLTAPDSLNIYQMCEGARRVFKVPTNIIVVHGPPSLGLDPKDPAIWN